MYLKKILVLCMIISFPWICSGQGMWYGEYDRLGLQAGMNSFNIVSGDLPISAGISWTAGFTGRSFFYEDFQFAYGINFFDFQNTVAGRVRADPASDYSDIEYNMIGVQGNFFGSYKILDHFLSVEAGPVIQVNGDFNARQDKELYYIQDYNLQAIDIEEVSTFNFNFAIGLTGGFESVKLWVQYQRGLNNILKGLNDNQLGDRDPGAADLRGHVSLFMAGVVMFL